VPRIASADRDYGLAADRLHQLTRDLWQADDPGDRRGILTAIVALRWKLSNLAADATDLLPLAPGDGSSWEDVHELSAAFATMAVAAEARMAGDPVDEVAFTNLLRNFKGIGISPAEEAAWHELLASQDRRNRSRTYEWLRGLYEPRIGTEAARFLREMSRAELAVYSRSGVTTTDTERRQLA
jgi:hypothetical protein